MSYEFFETVPWVVHLDSFSWVMRSIFHLTSKAKQLSYHLFGKNNYKLTQKAVTVIISPYVLLNRVKILCCQDMQKNLDTIRMKMKDGDSTKNHNENSHPVLNSLSPQLCKFVTEMQKKKKQFLSIFCCWRRGPW